MSGVVKAVKKVFKKVVKVIKKIIKPVLIAAAIYFTAGLALSAFPATAGFAASMPGFASGGFLGTGLAVGGEAVVAGAGVFSKAATAIGLGGGLAAGAATVNAGAAAAAIAGGMGVAEAASIYGVAAVEAAQTAAITGSIGSSLAASGAVGSTAAGTELAMQAAIGGAGGAGGISPAAAGILTKAGTSLANAPAAATGMGVADKILLAKVGTDVAGAMFGPSPQEIAQAEAVAAKTFVGDFYGGVTPDFGPNAQAGGQPDVAPPQATIIPDMGEPAITPEQQQLLAGRQKRDELFPTATRPPGRTVGPGQMQSDFPIPESLFGIGAMPGVRYINA